MTRALIAVDPALRRTGVSVWTYDDGCAGLLVLATSDTRRERDRYETLRHEIAQALAGARWWAVVEKPTPRGGGTPPTAAYRDWCEWLHDLARQRAADAGVPYRKPTIATPLPSQWRAALGLATRAPSQQWAHDERRAYLKAQAQTYADRVLRAGALDEDAAEATCLGAWGLRCARMGVMPGRGKLKPIHYVA